jgi:hypothetical protein
MRWRMQAALIRMKLPVANFVADIAQPRGSLIKGANLLI